MKNAANYVANTTTTTTANITPASLTVTAAGVNKTYDTTTTASVNLGLTALGSDSVTASNTSANFSDKNVANGKTVTVFAGAQNITNRKNFSGYTWDRRNGGIRKQEQLGLFPIIGLDWPF